MAAVLGLCVVAGAAGASPPRHMHLGLAEGAFSSEDAALRGAWMDRAQRVRADLITLGVTWSAVAPAARPPGFDPADPGEPAYDWGTLDAAVRATVGRGMDPLLVINRAPRWAEGPNRPSSELAAAGTWMPRPGQLRMFAEAVARRYSGRYDDPAEPGGALPRVHYFQIWAEQNLYVHLNPQWRRGRLFSPRHYRAMLNAAYAGIKRANRRARVVVGGLSPYGDPRPAGRRVPPVWFWRSLLCLRGAKLQPVRCPNPARFDIAAHNPINVGGPGRKALNPFDVSTPDMHKLVRIVRRAARAKRVRPARPKPFWATELWWDSRPPDPDGVPLRRHARFVTRSAFFLWRQGVSAMVWWYARDQSHAGGFAGTQQSGLYYRDGRPKPAARAFAFPFIANRDRRGGVLLWGKAPRSGPVVVERRGRGGWQPVARSRAGNGQVFTARPRLGGHPMLRARQGRATSMPWRLR